MGERRENEGEKNMNVWLPLLCPLLGTWPATQACALTKSLTSDPLILRLALNPLIHTSQWYSFELHCWWECRLVQPMWKTVWNFLRKLKMKLPFDPAIPLLVLYLKNPKTPVSCLYASDSSWLVSLFWSLDSTYKWDHMVFVFHWLAYFT